MQILKNFYEYMDAFIKKKKKMLQKIKKISCNYKINFFVAIKKNFLTTIKNYKNKK